MFTSKVNIIEGVASGNNMFDEIIVEVSVVSKANRVTFKPKMAKFKELVQLKKFGVEFLTFKTRLAFIKLR